jgi:hypothetical protein
MYEGTELGAEKDKGARAEVYGGSPNSSYNFRTFRSRTSVQESCERPEQLRESFKCQSSCVVRDSCLAGHALKYQQVQKRVSLALHGTKKDVCRNHGITGVCVKLLHIYAQITQFASRIAGVTQLEFL